MVISSSSPGIGNGNQGIVGGDHAEVAVRRFGRMHEQRRRAGRGQRGGDLAADVAGFADAGHDDAPLAVQQQGDGLHHAVVIGQARVQGVDGIGFVLQRVLGKTQCRFCIKSFQHCFFMGYTHAQV
jgi:hypothetical protein